MNKSSLIELLKTFSDKEIKEFSDFVISPFFNKNKNVIKLFNYIKKYHPDYISPKLEKQYTHNKIFSDVKYYDGYIRMAMSSLQMLAQDYLTYLHNDKNKIRNQISLSREFFKRDKFKFFEKEINDIEKLLGEVKIKDSDYTEHKYEIEQLKSDYYSVYTEEKGTGKDKFVKKDKPLTLSPKYLIINFLQKLLSEYRYILNEQLIIKFYYNFDFLDEIIVYLNKSKRYEEDPSLNINYCGVLLLKEKKDEYFHRLKRLLLKEIPNLKWLDKLSTMAVLGNYCTYKNMTGEAGFQRERFELDKITLKYGLYSMSEGGHISPNNFLSNFQNALSLKEFDWAWKFINDYKDKLAGEVKKEVFNLSMSGFHFEKGEYEKSLEYLNKIDKFNSLANKLIAKSLIIKIFYEMDLEEQFFPACDSLRHFLSNNKLISEFRAESYSNFQKFINHMMVLRNKPDGGGAAKLKEELAGETNLYNKKWLVEKAAELP
jgi:hypothetical protein